MHIKFLVALFLITINVIYSQKTQDKSKNEKKELEEIKKTPQYQQVRTKVINALSDKIDNYVLDQIRKKQ
ncbi:unnamed protein product [Schistosoma rodhaini]|uniref:Uncharacterized protein n=1 Tax=Schistosoma rodhaini TaxID=6188 RepID=A0AA85FR70_9TREM|nr:unnamed protein product [Schistosoma rodhaini]